MGLFSGGFGTGLATGLATSVSESLTDAMDRREEELSKARVFWQTRQAQKQDQVDAENKRIEKAYKRITNEMGGDSAKGLAAYQAIGGTIDDVERYINVLNKTQEANMNYSLQDKLDFDGLSLGDYGDFTYDKGFDSIKSVVTAADVNYVEAPSLLTAIGLGQDTERVGKSLQQQVDQLIPRSERTDAGIGAAKIKGRLYAGMIGEDEARKNYEKASMTEIIASKYQQLMGLKRGTPEYNAVQNELDEAIEIKKRQERTPTFTPTAAIYRSGLSDSLEIAIKNSTSAAGALQDAQGKPLTDDTKIKARMKELEEIAYTPYMDNLFNEDGTYKNPNARAVIELSGNPVLQRIAAQEQERRSGGASSGGKPPLTEDDKAKQEANAAALKVRDTLEDQATKTMEPLIKDEKITPDDEAKFIDSIVDKGAAGLDEGQLAAYKERVRSTYVPLFEEARENKKLGETPEGRFKILDTAVNDFDISDEVSTATIEAIDEGIKNTRLKYARLKSFAPEKELDNVTPDILEGKAKEDLDKILVKNGFDPAYIKRSSREVYDNFVDSLVTKYEQAITSQRDAGKLAEQEKRQRNILVSN